MDISRRWFIGGCASFGALAGCHLLRTPNGAMTGGGAALKFGIISDIHVDAAAGDFGKFGDTVTFRHTLAWFRDQGVDAVVLAGDMADNGFINQLQCVADAWYAVFPGDKAPDGRRVEKIFVYGNHDMEGFGYDQFGSRYHERSTFDHAKIARDPAAAWQNAFHEPYAPVYTKMVKGFRFVGAHWVDWKGIPAAEDWFRAHAREIDPSRPFFYVQHPHPKDTCYGDWAWGQDSGYATRALTPFPNAIAFSGHTHYSLTDERGVWQGAFTSIGTSSLRYGGMPGEAHKEGYLHGNGADRQAISAGPNPWLIRQGMLASVYPDRMVLERRDFVRDVPLGDDWVLPLPAAESKPFAFTERARKSVAPEFPAGSSIALTRDLKKKKFLLSFPAANAVPKARPFEYEVMAETRGGKPTVRFALAGGYNQAPGAPETKAETTCRWPLADLPKDAEVRFVVRPVECFGRKGAPLMTEWVRVEKKVGVIS